MAILTPSVLVPSDFPLNGENTKSSLSVVPMKLDSKVISYKVFGQYDKSPLCIFLSCIKLIICYVWYSLIHDHRLRQWS